jgi:hypothetical protein
LTFFVHDLLEEALNVGPQRRIAWKEDETGAVLSCRREVDADPACLLAKEPVGRLNQDPGTVAGIRLASTGAAMEQDDEDLEGLTDDPMRSSSFYVDDESDAARVMLMRRVVETLRWLLSSVCHDVLYERRSRRSETESSHYCHALRF